MNSENKVCQNCKQNFVIESEDFAFYERIEVPSPTFCPDCRLQRRMTWRNERSLYKRKCDAPGHMEDIISMYDPMGPYKIYDSKYWWSDGWSPLDYGAEYDFSRPFLSQFSELLKKVPLATLSNMNSVNCEYTNVVDGNKNCYLVFGGGWNENVRYANKMMNCKDSQDLYVTNKCELCYECVGCVECNRLLYGIDCKTCTDSAFLYGCRNCSICFGCANLVGKSYCIFNQQYSREEYLEKLKEFNLESYAWTSKIKERFVNEIYLKAIHRYANIVGSVNCTGNNINNSKNSKNCFDVFQNLEDCKYQYSTLDLKDAYDGNGIYKNPLGYELVDCNVGSQNLASTTIYDSSNISYSINCHSSSNLFGCIGLRSKHYCILNRQYTKEEYEKLVPQIIAHMDSMPFTDRLGRVHRYGEFFPSDISPFAHNETIAQEYFSITKQQAIDSGYRWKEPDARAYQITKRPSELPDTISGTDDSILSEVIGCEHAGGCNEQCTTAYKITPEELNYYRNLKLPIPTLCPNCRHYERLKKRTSMKLWSRKCQCSGAQSENGVYQNTITHQHGTNPCSNEFETSYSPNRPEIVYCENCYQAEVV